MKAPFVVPPAHRGYVALFYKPTPPSRIYPGQLMLIENYDGVGGRNIRHSGYFDLALATRPQSPEEHACAAHAGRYYANYYQSWPKLIQDEERIAKKYPSLKTGFVDMLRELAASGNYPLRKTAKLIEDESESSDGIGELTTPEIAIAKETAMAIGAKQLSLFANG